MPAVADLKPRGALFLEGRVTPGTDGVATDVRAAMSQLVIEEGVSPMTVSSATDASLRCLRAESFRAGRRAH